MRRPWLALKPGPKGTCYRVLDLKPAGMFSAELVSLLPEPLRVQAVYGRIVVPVAFGPSVIAALRNWRAR